MGVSGRLRMLCWHVHGSWMHAFVQGGHEYLLPVDPERSGFGLGRAGRPWSERVIEVPLESLLDNEIDVVVLQRPEELALAETWLGRRLGADVPAVYVEHNTPHERAATTRHFLADRDDIPVVHVTAFNQLMWDCGLAPTTVIDHGVVDPGPRFTGELPHAVAVVNEPRRRGRAVGADLLDAFRAAAPVDLFGIDAGAVASPGGPNRHALNGGPDLPLDELHTEMGRRRVYVHPARWTSLGLSLIEAMHLGMPVAVVASTAAATLPPAVGAVSCDIGTLTARVAALTADRDLAAETGAAAREHALAHFGLEQFLDRWDAFLARVID